MKREPIEDDGIYNIVRSHKGSKTIFRERLKGKDARRELMHWKRMARHSGGGVYFEAVKVPSDVLESIVPT